MTFLLLLAWQAAAQVTTASIGGRITDGKGPVEGVTVVAIHQQTNSQYYATSDRGGWYQLLDVLPGGPYTLRFHYFGYDPLTVRSVYAYTGQNTVVDADLEAGSCRVHTDEAATSLRVGKALEGGAVPVSPTAYELVSQQVYTEVPFDVRQEASLYGYSRLRSVPTGGRQLQASAYGFYGSGDIAGLSLAAPLAGEDFRLFAGLQYSRMAGLCGVGRFDARLTESLRLDAEGGRLSDSENWAAAGMTKRIGDGRASNRTQAGWHASPSGSEWLVSNDFTLAAGRRRLLLGGALSHGAVPLAGAMPDSTFTRFDFYVQDAVRITRRATLLAGVRFAFPFAVSPRLSLYCDVAGTGAVILRAGTALYGRHTEGSVWKNQFAVDTRLPLDVLLTLEATNAVSWRRLFTIASNNLLGSRYSLTARLERPFADHVWAVASYTHDGGDLARDRFVGGFSYRAEYLGRYATTAALLYRGDRIPVVSGDPTSAGHDWTNALEARLSQYLPFTLAGRDHRLLLTGYLRHTAGRPAFLIGINYNL